MTELCKHDWTGDEECAYCKCEELERQLAAKDTWIDELETSNPVWELLTSTQNEVVKWKKEVIKWQDTDTDNQGKIEKAATIRKKLEKRIHNQRVALRDNWMIIDQRMKSRPTLLRSMWWDLVKRYGIKIQDQDTEIADLKRGFIDVDDALKKDVRISKLEQAIHNTLDTGMNRYIEEAMEKRND